MSSKRESYAEEVAQSIIDRGDDDQWDDLSREEMFARIAALTIWYLVQDGHMTDQWGS